MDLACRICFSLVPFSNLYAKTISRARPITASERDHLDSNTSDRDIEEYIVSQVASSKPETVNQLVAIVRQKYSLSDKKISNLLTKLEEEGRLNFIPKESPPSDFRKFLMSSKASWFWAAIGFVIVTSATVLLVPEDSYPLVFIRYILGGVLVLFLPGYMFILALYPANLPLKTLKERFENVERFALSIGMSLALVTLVGLLLNYTPWGIRLTPIVISLTILTIAFALAATAREHQTRANQAPLA
jgi:putative Mn2+ efflux pump MntP